eukprot:3713114-Rhodomonas_salina.4
MQTRCVSHVLMGAATRRELPPPRWSACEAATCGGGCGVSVAMLCPPPIPVSGGGHRGERGHSTPAAQRRDAR